MDLNIEICENINKLKINSDDISFETFQILTGKQTDFLEKRRGKEILVRRIKGHLYISDKKFVLDTIYKKDRKKYRCIHVDEKEAVLIPTDDSKLDILCENNPSEWIIDL